MPTHSANRDRGRATAFADERDATRRAAVQTLLATGKLQSGRDFHFAAMVFQHSEAAKDVRLAHLLAVTAVAKEHESARWLAAATFDRHLWHLNQPQVFGTQFKQTEKGDWTMDPYDREAVPDHLRADWCVISLSEQTSVLAAMREGRSAGATNIADCK